VGFGLDKTFGRFAASAPSAAATVVSRSSLSGYSVRSDDPGSLGGAGGGGGGGWSFMPGAPHWKWRFNLSNRLNDILRCLQPGPPRRDSPGIGQCVDEPGPATPCSA